MFNSYTNYSISQILNSDFCLLIRQDGKIVPIQNSHISNEQLLSTILAEKSEWRFIRTTHEEISVFHHVGPSIESCLIIEPDQNIEGAYWVTPKEFPREQYVY